MEFFSVFEVPHAASSVIGDMVAAEERRLIEALSAREFSRAEAMVALAADGGPALDGASVDGLLDRAYRRGVLELVDDGGDRFAVSTFYDRLGVLVAAEPETFRALPPGVREELDDWFLRAYAASLDDGDLPTGDRVRTLDRILDSLEEHEGPIWLASCDCRVLSGRCGKPVDTCVTFRGGINSLAHRGWATPITKAEAKAVVSRADRAGLMHTISEGGICNCCSDCCYLFRAQELRGRGLDWPVPERMADFDGAACSACGLCVRRCPFGALTRADDGAVVFDPSVCRGCGVCATACPSGALSMHERPGI